MSVSEAATSWDGEIAAATAAAASDRGGRRSCANPGLVYWGRGQRSRSGGRGRQGGFPVATHIPGYKRPSQQHWTIRTRVKVCFVSINICRKQWPPKSVTFCFGRYCQRQIGSVFCVLPFSVPIPVYHRGSVYSVSRQQQVVQEEKTETKGRVINAKSHLLCCLIKCNFLDLKGLYTN